MVCQSMAQEPGIEIWSVDEAGIQVMPHAREGRKLNIAATGLQGIHKALLLCTMARAHRALAPYDRPSY
jgi:hypothetical protein